MSLSNIQTELTLSVYPFTQLLKPVTELQAKTAEKESLKEINASLQTQEKLEQMKEKAIQEGKKEGFQIGQKEGFEVGYQKGFEKVKEEYVDKIQDFADQLQQKSDQVIRLVEQWYIQAEEELANLAILISKRLIMQELQLSRESILSMVREMLKEVTYGTNVRIYVNPFDIEIIEEHKEDILSKTSHLKDVEIIEDNSIEAGCVLESDLGVIDARIENMLRKLANTALGTT